ncbi:hypothetical protein RRG08_047811 [Elysia crispata]|uniref:Uncharacterized protein n=1 Tax=Elysia crispata TaxID=231223 RepID=A0AAE0Y2U3_9GAST|nr:hypothetical protein RRG08_047811 [Elysia crispata]
MDVGDGHWGHVMGDSTSSLPNEETWGGVCVGGGGVAGEESTGCRLQGNMVYTSSLSNDPLVVMAEFVECSSGNYGRVYRMILWWLWQSLSNDPLVIMAEFVD